MRSDTVTPRTPDARPVLIYDGDCAFCLHWVRYWQRLTGANVSYAPYQQVGARYPQITTSEFRRAVQYVAAGRAHRCRCRSGVPHLGACARQGVVARALSPSARLRLALRAHYALVAAHRGIAYRATLLLWGRDAMPPRFELTARLFIARTRARLSRRLRLARRADRRARRRRRHPSGARLSRGGRAALRRRTLLALSDAVLVRRRRSHAAGGVRGGCGGVRAAAVACGAARQPRAAVRPLSLALLRRPDVHELPVGPAPARVRLSGLRVVRPARAAGVDRPLAGVSFHVHVGPRQARWATRRG